MTQTTYENAIFPLQYINNTQREDNAYSHKGDWALDTAGKDSGIDSAHAPFTCKVLAIFKWKETIFPNTVLIGSCDYDGNPAKVICDDKVARVVTLQFTHDNDISDLAVGMVIRSGERFYEEGTTGNATGNHIHIEAAEGWQYKQVKINGVYQLPNRIHVYQVFNILKGWNIIRNELGYSYTVVETRGTPSSSAVEVEKIPNTILQITKESNAKGYPTRTKPSTSASISFWLKKNESFAVIGEANEGAWYQIAVNGKTGFVMYDPAYMQIINY